METTASKQSLAPSHKTRNARHRTQLSDDELITEAQCGDHSAFVELCKRHSSIAKKKIFSIVQNREDAEDAMQDTLLRAYTHMSSFRRSCTFATWITAIGVNSALMTLRKRRTRREFQTGYSDDGTPELWEPIDDSPGPESIYQKRQTVFLIRREMRSLRPNLRSILDLYYTSDSSLEKSAETLEISVAAAKSRLMRGRLMLRSRLARHGLSKLSAQRL